MRQHQKQQLEAQALPQLGRAFKLKSGLLTHNGPWGCLPASEGGLAVGASASAQAVPPTGDSSSSTIFDGGRSEPAEAGPLTSAFHGSSPVSFVGDLTTLTRHLATSVVVRQLWAEFRGVVEGFVNSFNVESWGASFELCTRTFEGQGSIRIHGHFFFCGQQALTFPLRVLQFRRCGPALSGIYGNIGSRGLGAYAGLFYVRVPKIGSICSAGNKDPIRDFQ